MRNTVKHLAIAVVATTLCNCGGNNQPQDTAVDTTAAVVEEEVAPLTFKTERTEQKYKNISSEICIAYPTDGPEVLVQNIREYISETLGGTFKGNLTNANNMVNYYAASIVDRLKNEYEDDVDEKGDPIYTFDSIYVEADKEKYITLTLLHYEESGGPHGYASAVGTTFRKSDGRKFTKDLMTGLNTPEFNQIVKEGLKEYFGEEGKGMSDDELKEELMSEDGSTIDMNHLPLPKEEPYFDEKGIVFHYGSYEIACYAAGQPEFIVPFDKAKKFLKETALEMIE